jgi:rhamnose transport system permease protein
MSEHTRPRPRARPPARPAWQVAVIRPEVMTFVLLILAVIAASQISEFFLDIRYILDSFTLSPRSRSSPSS